MARTWTPAKYRIVGVSLAIAFTVLGLIIGRLTAPVLMPDDFSTQVGNLFNQGKTDEVLRLCSETIARDPKHFDARWVRADELRRRLRYPEALEDLNIAIASDPNHPNAYHAFYSRGRVHNKLGQDEKAIPDYNESIKRNSAYAWAYVWRGKSHGNLNHYRQALDDYNVFFNRGIEDPELRLRAARMAIECGEFDQAETLIRLAKANAGNNQSIIARAEVLDDERVTKSGAQPIAVPAPTKN